MTQSYLEQLATLAKKEKSTEWLADAIARPASIRNKRRAQLYSLDSVTKAWQSSALARPDDLLDILGKDPPTSFNFLMLEDIGPDWMAQLGPALQIPPMFFVDHARNPTTRSAKAIWGELTEEVQTQQLKPGERRWQSIPGIYEHHDLPWLDRMSTSSDLQQTDPVFWSRLPFLSAVPSIACLTTRLSYIRLRGNLYLFLVDRSPGIYQDRPAGWSTARTRTTIRVPSIHNRGGHGIPQLLSHPVFDLQGILGDILTTGYTVDFLLFRWPKDDQAEALNQESALGTSELLHIWSTAVWEANRITLRARIEHTSFNDLREPNVETNSLLHDYRQDLQWIKLGVIECRTYMPPQVRDFFAKYQGDPLRDHVLILDRILQQTVDLNSFLMETFQLHLSSISILDTRLSLAQAKRGSRLTILAAIYLPLTLVVGIYGMNIREINGASIPWWAPVVTCVGVALGTAMVFLVMILFERRADRKS